MEKKKKRGLTVKQQKFVAAYVGNATDAARKAGYSEETAKAIGQENLTKPVIMEALAKKMTKAINPLIAEKTKRLEWLVGEMNNKKHQITARLKAYELLAKSCGDFLTPGIGPTGGGQQAPPTVIVIRAGKDSQTAITINPHEEQGDRGLVELPRGEPLPIKGGIGDRLPDEDGEDWMDGEKLPEEA